MSDSLVYAFDHVHVYCTDLAASEQWFVEKLGAELVQKREARGALTADVLLAGTKILLREKLPNEELVQPGPSRFGTDHMGLVVNDLAATVQELKRRGVEFESDIKEISPGLQIIFMRGPDMIRIELLQRD